MGEERTYVFARDVRKYVKSLPKSMSNFEDVKQVIRSSGSIGANYIEATELKKILSAIIEKTK